MCWLHLFKAVTSNSISPYINQRCSVENSQSDFESSTNMKTSLAVSNIYYFSVFKVYEDFSTRL